MGRAVGDCCLGITAPVKDSALGRYHRKTDKGTRTTLAKPEGSPNLDHVLVALRKELRAELQWGDEEMKRAGFHTVIPELGDRGLYVVALTPEDAKLANEFAAMLRAKQVPRQGHDARHGRGRRVERAGPSRRPLRPSAERAC